MLRGNLVSLDYPLLGEPLLIELLNTSYTDADGHIDFLSDRGRAQGWVNALSDRLGARIELDAEATVELRRLRDAVRLLTTHPDPRPNSTSLKDAVNAINRAGSLAPRTPQLRWTRGRVMVESSASPYSVESLLSSLAADAVDIIGGTTGIETCSRPACHMLFLRQHHRRRYCNDRCASADRQSRYYHRVNAAT